MPDNKYPRMSATVSGPLGYSARKRRYHNHLLIPQHVASPTNHASWPPVDTEIPAANDEPVSPVDLRHDRSRRDDGRPSPPISPVEERSRPLYNKYPARTPVDLPSQQPQRPHGYGGQAPQGNQQGQQAQRQRQGPRYYPGEASRPPPQRQPSRHGGNTMGSSDHSRGVASDSYGRTRTAQNNPDGNTSQGQTQSGGRGERKDPKKRRFLGLL
ncbi:hypothetical protein FQN53_006004 [Emmonsiellopsis sp. PD_33]|nr:hypothetical protein FQN53_006004 [Emmonsiellopsis sp. PD_33]